MLSGKMVKTSVAELQELCAKYRLNSPTYEFSKPCEAGFDCRVSIETFTGFGSAQKKHDAKHLAAADVLEKLKRGFIAQYSGGPFEDGEDTPGDMILLLRNYCVRQEQPLAKCIVTKLTSVTDDDDDNDATAPPRYKAIYRLGDIVKFAESDDEMHAKQMAALAMLRHYKVGEVTEYDFPNTKSVKNGTAMHKMTEEECAKKFSAFLKLVGSTVKEEKKAVPLCDRHDYFSKFPAALKEAAFAVIEGNYCSDRDKAMAIFDALGLVPKLSSAPSLSAPLIVIDLDIDFEAIFINTEDQIYRQVIDYFSVMLL